MAALEKYEREHGLYVQPDPEDIMFFGCPECGQPWEADARGYTEEERDLMLRAHAETDPETHWHLSEKVWLINERRGIALWGHAHFWARSDAGHQALKEKTGDDLRSLLDEERRRRKGELERQARET
jgi:hypothetical protein